MGYAEASQIIHAPVETVWNALNDIYHTPMWVVGLENAEIVTDGEYGKGTTYYDFNRLGPMIQITAWHITAFEPMTLQVHESDSEGLPSRMMLTLAPTGEGTLVKMSVEFRFMPKWGRVGRLFENLILRHLIRNVLGQNLRQLDQYLGRLPARMPVPYHV